MVATALVTAALGTITSGIGLAKTILKRKTPSEAKKLGKLEVSLIDIIRQRTDEEAKIDPCDELIQKLYKDEEDTHGKIQVYIKLATSQQQSIDS